MKLKLDKIFNPYSLLVINIIVISLSLTIGGGLFFHESGLIHLITIFFLALAILRVFSHYYTYDPILEKFVHMSLISLIALSIAHLIEFISLDIFHKNEDAVIVNLVNFYLISLIVLIIGTEYFSKIRYKLSSFLIKALPIVIFIFVIITIIFFINDQMVSLKIGGLMPCVYTALIFIIGLLAVIEVSKIKKLTAVTVGFVNYLTGAVVFIIISTLIYILHSFIASLGIPEYQVDYFSHFTFYAALSLIFLAFTKLSYLGGVYEELRGIKR